MGPRKVGGCSPHKLPLSEMSLQYILGVSKAYPGKILRVTVVLLTGMAPGLFRRGYKCQKSPKKIAFHLPKGGLACSNGGL